MRAAPFLLLLVNIVTAHAQSGLVINELQAANHGTFTDSAGHTPDWIELYNAGRAPIDLTGMRIAIAGRQHMIDAPLMVPPKGRTILLCDAHPERGTDHLGFTLPRNGGTALLIAADGTTIMDVFTWPSLSSDMSMGRVPDGAKAWSFFEQPTPGDANRTLLAVRSRAATPIVDQASGLYAAPFTVSIALPNGAEVRYTLDGSEPTVDLGARYTSPLPIATNTVVRARSFAAGQLASEELTATYIFGGPQASGIAITIAPDDLWSESIGIDNNGEQANHTRKGMAWERPATIQFLGDSTTARAGLRISGSGSRGLAKRSFKLYARDQYDSPTDGLRLPGETAFSEALLRADASPNAFLRNSLIEVLVRRYNLHVDMQPSTPLPLYLNAHYWGLYRWMPPKDAEWLRHISGAEAVDVLEGPAATVLSGKDDTFLAAQRMLLVGAPIDSINALIDVPSLIDLACIDLFTGRADHDLNVRCYRPRQVGGRWRWILFDLDLWAPADENSLERMCSASASETPYVPQLLAQPELQQLLLARTSALLATVFDPTSAGAITDSLFHANETELLADHQRWIRELDRPDPQTSARELRAFIAARPAHLLNHLSTRTGRGLRSVTITAPSAEQGLLLLEGLPLSPGEHSVQCFRGVPMTLEFQPTINWEFAGWKGLDTDAAITTQDLSRAKSIKPLVRTVVP